MKKTLIGLMMATAFTAQAADIGLSVGRDGSLDREIVVLSVGTSAFGLNTSVEVSKVEDAYHSIGSSVGKSFKLFGVGLLPYASLGYVHADASNLKNGRVGATGVEVSYAVSKNFSLTADYSYRWDLKQDTNYEGSLLTLGIKTTF
jgi:hypothetical protein